MRYFQIVHNLADVDVQFWWQIDKLCLSTVEESYADYDGCRRWPENWVRAYDQGSWGRKQVKFLESSFEPPHDKTIKMACAPIEDSYQPGHSPRLISLCCPHEETFGPQLPIEHTVKTLVRLGGCPGWSEYSLGAVYLAHRSRRLIWWVYRIGKPTLSSVLHTL